MPAPKEAIEYWHLKPEAKLRDVILSIRADEVLHREVNHHFADIPTYHRIEMEDVEIKEKEEENVIVKAKAV